MCAECASGASARAADRSPASRTPGHQGRSRGHCGRGVSVRGAFSDGQGVIPFRRTAAPHVTCRNAPDPLLAWHFGSQCVPSDLASSHRDVRWMCAAVGAARALTHRRPPCAPPWPAGRTRSRTASGRRSLPPWPCGPALRRSRLSGSTGRRRRGCACPVSLRSSVWPRSSLAAVSVSTASYRFPSRRLPLRRQVYVDTETLPVLWFPCLQKLSPGTKKRAAPVREHRNGPRTVT